MKRIITLIFLVASVAMAVAVAVVLFHQTPAHPTTQPTALRIISLSPAMTEALYEMGLGDRLVGVSQACNYPPEATKLPQVGSLGMTNMETMLSLAPTMVVTTDFERDDTMQAIRSSGVQVVEGHIATIQQMFESFEKIGKLTGHPQQAATLVQKMKGDLAGIHARFAATPVERRPRVYLEVWHDPITTAGSQSFMDDVLAHAGGTNAAHEISRDYPIISPEKVIEWNPQVVVLCDETTRGRGLEIVRGRIGWERIDAVKNNRVIDDLSMDLLIRPGPRLTQGIRQLCERLYPTESGR